MKPKIYTADDHHIRENLIDPDAVWILQELQNARHVAYLVGGGVRDLLLNRQPKDFDISTSATPEEIKKLFGRKCLLIGRRFRLAHIRFGKKIIEVATFRSGDEGANVWGSAEEDVLRRDFTINGLFYDPADHKIIDYVGGFEDLQQHYLRSIGTPEVRFQEDPVRMIRCLKFRARFEFNIEPACIKAIETCKEEILKSSSARLLEEFLRMLESGASAPFIQLLSSYGLLQLLFPVMGELLTSDVKDRVHEFLQAADQMKQLDRSVIATAIAYPLVEKVLEVDFDHAPNLQEIHHICSNVVHELFVDVHPRFTRRHCHNILFILDTQFRLTPLTNRRIRVDRQTKLNEFPLAIQFFKLRSMVDPNLKEQYEKWKRFETIRYQPQPIRRRRRGK